jgi:hypothetical protein
MGWLREMVDRHDPRYHAASQVLLFTDALSKLTFLNISCFQIVTFVWKKTFAKLGEDWVFLAVLGILMAVISFAMDFGISMLNRSRIDRL